jgi:hypothetical protein
MSDKVSKMKSLFDFIEMNCIKYNIDESHGLKHAMGTVKWAEKLMSELNDIDTDERNMIIYSAALHDMCDSKYRNIGEACDEISTWLISQGWSEIMASNLISIITTMSYTKLKKTCISGQKCVYPNHGPWQRAYHIVRHADLLEAYRVVRCYLYSKRRKPDWSEDELWAETEKIFAERVFKYVSDGWIFLDSALTFIPSLEADARRCFKERDTSYVL